MSGRDVVLLAVAVLTVSCPAALALACRMRARNALPGDVVMMLALGIGCGFYAVIGWGWWLFTGVLR